MDPVRLPPIKLITYSGSRALRQPDTERSLKKHYLKAIKNAREKNSIQLWQNIRYNPSPPLNNPHTYPLFPTTTMSDSPADDTFDDHKLPDELEEGAQLAGNSDTGQSSPLSPSPVWPCSVMIDDETRRCAHGSPCSPPRPRIYTRETGSWSSQGQQEQEECCGHSRFHVRSCPSGWREEEKG